MAKTHDTKTRLGRRLQELVDDEHNSITGEVAKSIDERQYERIVDHLASYLFWQRNRRRARQLWSHQISAICTGIAYLVADKRLPAEGGAPEAALIKMPTGTGKSGVIAVLSRCLPNIRRVLILTPRTALADQLRQDIRWRFWQHLGCKAEENRTYVADVADAGAALEEVEVIHLLPSRASELEHSARHDRLIAVGTFQALEQLRRDSHRALESGEDSDASRAVETLSSFDLVVVDEGHYEPAPRWSRAVRDLALPTILLSATPYRNDYKSFRVRGRFVFNYSLHQAIDDKTIRIPEFTSGSNRSSASGVQAFVKLMRGLLPDVLKTASKYTENPKVIVRADDYKKLIQLQNAIEKAFGQRPILIHHQVEGSEGEQRRFKSVAQALEAKGSEKTRFWLHESKLLEGIDDPSFVAIAIYDRFSNARQLVQQIGRALRTTDKSRQSLQSAWIIALPEHQKFLKASWKRYEDFEKYAAADPQRLVQAESALPDKLLSLMPEVQYLGGEFRPRFAAGEVPSAEDFRVPASAAVFEVPDSFELAAAAKTVEESLLAEDRFKPLRIAGMPDESLAFAYYGWRCSPYLSLQFFPEWTLGICVLVRVGTLLFIQDTGGIVLTNEELGMQRAGRDRMARLMPPSTDAQHVRISRIATFSLDISERAIRSIALRTRSLADTFGDLLDPVLVPTTAFGFVGGRGRYLGLTRSRISDSFSDPLPLLEFCQWARKRALELSDPRSAYNSVFDRYAVVRDRLDRQQAKPISILLDFDDTFTDYTMQADADGPAKLLRDVKYDDLCSDVDDEGTFSITLEDKAYSCKISFNEGTQRYKIESEDLDTVLTARHTDAGATPVPITSHMNREQSFRIIVQEPGVIYAHRRFFVPNTSYVRPDDSIPLLAAVYGIGALDLVTTEKGETLYPTQRAVWSRQSIFGLVKTICGARALRADWDRLYADLRSFDTIVCDDDGKEIGDFIAIDVHQKRVAIIHAKAARTPSYMSVGALQEVGRQVLASLAFCSAVSREAKIRPGRWATNVNANGTQLALGRVFRNTARLTVAEIEALADRTLADRSWNREIWILAGNLMSRNAVEEAIRNNNSNRAKQFLMYLESLITGCARANSQLRIYCNP